MKRLIMDGVKVQTCVTSPPYWGLRDYGAEGQIGLERTPQEYVEKMVEVFGLVRDLLSEDGTLWLNMGDSYAANHGSGSVSPGDKQVTNYGSLIDTIRSPKQSGLKPKDLVGIPWMVAFALRNAGWYLRCDIIWHKPNAMPESVTDRPTKSHEYLFLLSKNERYYYDAEAIAEPAKRERWGDQTENKKHQGTAGHLGGKTIAELPIKDTKNKRSVWTVPTMPYPGSHFAVFPPALIEPCIMAGSRPGDIVLDSFFGSGTTGQVAEKLGRQWIGCEIQQNYEPLQKQRTAQTGMVLCP